MDGVKAKDIAARLGNPDKLGSIADTRKRIADTIAPRLGQLIAGSPESETGRWNRSRHDGRR